ncbi:hypothetical protein C8Q80DRAFT_441681 [Daedaleopsis nitida]|nr:hypothetical protein C8Q80DRAFT_441681 [Daedaleopsis nitida]
MFAPSHSSGLASIHDLPNEILVKIYQTYTFQDHQCSIPRLHRRHPRLRHASCWSFLMLVCRHWRAVALATPTLWQVIDVFKTTNWLELALERSHDAVLELYFHDRDAALASIPLIISQSRRLRILHLPGTFMRSDLPSLEALFQTMMPVLHELRIHLEPSRTRDRTTASPIPVASIDTHFPSLRSIRLESAAVPWTLPALSRMRYLNLRDCTTLDTDLTFDQFLDTLEGCTELEDLRIHSFVSTTVHQVPAGFARTVFLPRLQRLTVREPPALCRQLLSAVRISPTTILRVFGKLDPNMDPSGAQGLFMSMLPEDPSRIPAIRTLKYANVYCHEIISFSLQSASRASHGPDLVMLTLDTPQDIAAYIPRALEDFARLFSSAPLEDVQISCTPDSDSVHTLATWSRVFAALPAVHTLAVDPGWTLRPMWAALAGRHLPLLAGDSEADAAVRALCPCLRLLELQYVIWEENALDCIFESMRLRARRGLPKLDVLGITFFSHRGERAVAVAEFQRALPVYEERMGEFAASFHCGLSS